MKGRGPAHEEVGCKNKKLVIGTYKTVARVPLGERYPCTHGLAVMIHVHVHVHIQLSGSRSWDVRIPDLDHGCLDRVPLDLHEGIFIILFVSHDYSFFRSSYVEISELSEVKYGVTVFYIAYGVFPRR